MGGLVVKRTEPLIVAKALGGRIELYSDRICIVRVGIINYLLNFIGGRVAVVESVFSLERVSGVAVVRPILWNDYLTVTYPGSPPQVGRPLIDATAENAIFLGFFDNRHIHRLVNLTRDLISASTKVRLAANGNGRRLDNHRSDKTS